MANVDAPEAEAIYIVILTIIYEVYPKMITPAASVRVCRYVRTPPEGRPFYRIAAREKSLKMGAKSPLMAGCKRLLQVDRGAIRPLRIRRGGCASDCKAHEVRRSPPQRKAGKRKPLTPLIFDDCLWVAPTNPYFARQSTNTRALPTLRTDASPTSTSGTQANVAGRSRPHSGKLCAGHRDFFATRFSLSDRQTGCSDPSCLPTGCIPSVPP